MTTTILSDDNPQLLLLQPVDSHDLEELETEVNSDGAEGTLRELLSILEKQRQQLGWDPSASLRRVVLGGYSLAGLFALWAGTEEPFGGIVAASPSVWYREWISYATTHPSRSAHVYLSLGDREHRSKTPIMATVNGSACCSRC